jgi:outer membrane protein assembly factor BamD
MRHIINILAQSELKVARHYYNKGAYVAAVNRAQATLNDYPNSEAAETALIVLIDSYRALGLNQLSEDTQRVLKASFPDSKYFPKPASAKPEKKSWFNFW